MPGTDMFPTIYIGVFRPDRTAHSFNAEGTTMSIYDGDLEARATGASYLEKRIEINRSYSSADFDAWLLEHLALRAGDDVLDVGCGSGSQTVPFSEIVGDNGSVSALDISAESVELLKSRVRHPARVQATAADMNDLEHIIENEFRVKQYDLAQSAYALYYSDKRIDVLDVMRSHLKPGGRCAVFTPNAPHGLVELAGRFTDIPKEIDDCMEFGPKVLAPYFEANFPTVTVHHFHNEVSLPSAELLLEFYRQTTYYDETAEDPMRRHAETVIAKDGAFRYEKNGYLIVGQTDD